MSLSRQITLIDGTLEEGEKLPPKKSAKNVDVYEKGVAGRNPGFSVTRQSTPGHNAMDVGMVGQQL